MRALFAGKCNTHVTHNTHFVSSVALVLTSTAALVRTSFASSFAGTSSIQSAWRSDSPIRRMTTIIEIYPTYRVGLADLPTFARCALSAKWPAVVVLRKALVSVPSL